MRAGNGAASGSRETPRRRAARAAVADRVAPGLRPLVSFSLGSLLRDAGRKSDAAPLFERAAALRAHENGPELAIALDASATELASAGKSEDAADRYRRALAIWERTPDSDL